MQLTETSTGEAVPSRNDASRPRTQANPKPGRLYPLLRGLRNNPQDSSAETPEPSTKSANEAPRRQQRQPGRAANRPSKRVDLYLNETGYPQSKPSIPGHEEQELHSRRREHLAPTPPEATGDALSGLVDAVAKHSRVSRPAPRRRPEGIPRRNADGSISFQPRAGGSDRFGPRSSDGAPTRDGEREGRKLPGLRDRQSRFKTQGGPGGNRSGPGGPNRRQGGPRPGGMRPRRRQDSKLPSVPAKIFDPAPVSVVGNNGYTHASPLPPRGAVPKVQMSMHRAQWQLQKRDVEKVHLGSNTAAAVLKGDWQNYIAPVFKQTAELEKKKSTHGMSNEARNEILDRATRAVVMNSSMRLQGKLQVPAKVASLL